MAHRLAAPTLSESEAANSASSLPEDLKLQKCSWSWSLMVYCLRAAWRVSAKRPLTDDTLSNAGGCVVRRQENMLFRIGVNQITPNIEALPLTTGWQKSFLKDLGDRNENAVLKRYGAGWIGLAS